MNYKIVFLKSCAQRYVPFLSKSLSGGISINRSESIKEEIEIQEEISNRNLFKENKSTIEAYIKQLRTDGFLTPSQHLE